MASPPRLLPTPTDVPDWVDPAMYPFTPKAWSGPDGVQRYVDEGHGRPIVFVHGTPSWSFEWRHALRSLRLEARVLALDHLGFGLSNPAPPSRSKPAHHAERLLAWFDHLDLHDVTVVLHDFGGPIGLPLALDRADRVRSVVLLNTWAWPLSPRRDTRWMSRLFATRLGRWLYRRLNVSPRWIVPASFGDRRRLSPEVHAHYLAPFPTPDSREPLWRLAVELVGSDPYYAGLQRRLDELADRPVTLVWGLADPAFGPDELARWQRRLPHAHAVAVPRVGHFPQEEAPDALVGAIRANLRARADRSAGPAPIRGRLAPEV